MKKNNRKKGFSYEKMAAVYLEKKGYQILGRNFRCRQGEIDLIAKEQDILVFAEVKYRADLSMGMPEEAVVLKKQKVISKCALVYMMQKNITDMQIRFDVIAILGGKIRHIQDAFDYIE